MTTQSLQMTGGWEKIADGDIELSAGSYGGFVQVQDDGASAATLARNYGERLFPGALFRVTGGSQAVYGRGKLDDVWTVTGAGAVAGIDVRDLVPTPPPTPGDDPDITAVFADGWQATWPSPPADVTSSTATVTRSGYNASGVATTFDETLNITARVREPGVATPTPETVALSDYVYSGETITGVTNSSTRAYPYAQFAWLVPDFQEVGPGQNSIPYKIAVAHRHARDGKPVAGIRMYAMDHLGNEVSTLELNCTGETYATSGFTGSIYEGSVDITGLSSDGAQDRLITLDPGFLPWVGTEHRASVFTAGKSFAENTVLKYGNNRNNWRQTLYAYVDPAAGGGAAVSTDPAVAATTPFATTALASAALRNWHDANTGRGAIDGSVMRLVEATHTHSVMPNRVCDNYCMTIEGVPGSTPANVIYQDAGSSTDASFPEKALVRNLTITRTTASAIRMIDAGTSTRDTYLAMQNVAIDDGGFSPTSNFFWRYDASYFEECTQDSAQVAAQKLVGCNGSFTGPSTVACVASRVPNGQIAPNNASRADGLFVGWSHITAARADFSQVLFINYTTTALGFAVVGSVMESYGSGGAGSAFLINGDGTTQESENINLIGSTWVGGRMNTSYTDAGGATRYDHLMVSRFNIYYERNTKAGDFFGYQGGGTNAARVGNWNIRYGVGHLADTLLQGQSQDAAPNGFYPLSWLGDVAPAGSISGGVADSALGPLSVSFTDDQSGSGGTGGGDYTPTSGTDLATIPSDLAAYPFDLSGAAISSGGVSGALQL
ncbi:hypothetical protein [Dinoroseobacter sp. S124A]|uniref:hypothetical protein n=1 Tax=Dinoroseobacter sp. S124A TaxID=3415128 RepID=UPI003C7E8DA9